MGFIFARNQWYVSWAAFAFKFRLQKAQSGFGFKKIVLDSSPDSYPDSNFCLLITSRFSATWSLYDQSDLNLDADSWKMMWIQVLPDSGSGCLNSDSDSRIPDSPILDSNVYKYCHHCASWVTTLRTKKLEKGKANTQKDIMLCSRRSTWNPIKHAKFYLVNLLSFECNRYLMCLLSMVCPYI